MRIRMIVAVATATMLLAGLASAHRVTGIDGNDVPGRFDILRTVVNHPGDLILETHVTGDLRKTHFRGENQFLWSMDTFGDGDLDYSVFLDARRGATSLRMRCIFLRHGSPPKFEGSTAGRIDGQEGSCKFHPRRVGGLPEQWNATTEYAGKEDYAPDTNTYSHEFGS